MSKKKKNLKPVVCAGAIIFRMSKNKVPEFLLIKPSKGNGDEWGLPKGHAEKGESVEETAVREVYEETGIIPKLLFELPPVFTTNPDEFKTVHFWIATQVNPKPPKMQKEEVSDIGWFRCDKLPKVHEYQIPAIQMAIKTIKRNMQ